MPSKRRRRGGTSGQRGAGSAAKTPSSFASWKWWTFPVYFALSVGLFAGYNVGVLSHSQPRLLFVGNYLFAILFSFGLAQFVTRPFSEWMLRRRAQRARGTGSQPGTPEQRAPADYSRK